jgi:hypothetical protein
VPEIEADRKEFFAVLSEFLEVGRGRRPTVSRLAQDG